MEDVKKIKSALVSVFHKDGLDNIIKLLHENGVKLISTGGTKSFIENLGFPCQAVEDLTGYPSILGGRVKTLHPKVFGGILARRSNDGDRLQMSQYDIPEIDLVIVDLYPFEDTVASGACEQDIIEKIDIGGISLIRGAAKNFDDVVIVASKAQYEPLQSILETSGAKTTLEQRKYFAKEAFAVSSAYDSAIFNWFDKDSHSALRLCKNGSRALRYGENPHQKACFYGDFDKMFDKLHGKEISYNNLLDIDAAVNLIADFDTPTFAILKHNNACGIASRPSIEEAWDAALACDPVSAFGGVLIANGPIDEATAQKINKIFLEVIIAPNYNEKALEVLKTKKNRIILKAKDLTLPNMKYRSALNGVLAQEADSSVEKAADFRIVTDKQPTASELADLEFALKVVKHSKSNAIVLAKGGQLCASGIGQTSRVDSLKQAIAKAQSFGFDLNGAVMASDAFFPFADCVEIAHDAGITAIVHPGGSVRDQDSIDYCNANDMSMAMTGIRHFKH
ncbi:MAG: bifunctional phosphoribosylaminoimidazolecarboxamide formyltransferase/IMP cyclohydrolase [Muribaculaceae bacterium]|nr:bifunctional phosphoribosylaminoimidazolecarboxamide formyltransferase/IMP cyclohydrolase [Muribaculaceae bacterium]